MALPDLHHRAIVADAHNDLLMAVAARPPRLWGSFFRERWLPQLREGGINIQVLPVFIDDQYRPEGALRQTLRMIECAHVLAEANADQVSLCLNGADIDAALATDRIALVLALESAPGIDASVELIPALFRLGVRIASVAHWGRTPLADGSREDATGSRLTTPGIQALREMERLGMLFDVSHLSATGVAHVLEIATRPLIATHSCARVLRDHHRNLTDEQIRGVASTGGVICVNFVPDFLTDTQDKVDVDRIVDHIEHIASLTGIDHVGLGSDFVREIIHDVTPPCCESLDDEDPMFDFPGLEGPAGMPLLTEALIRRGFPEADLLKILGGNVRRLMTDHMG
ncbi:dipeptidase [Streptomyces sp. NPDC101733]|uniref:dipeptidase n=1 Tax=unclassified Streptomyces TaxID=2593676 RepID=UPI0037F6C219